MKVAVVYLTNGRQECIARSCRSMEEHLLNQAVDLELWAVEDTGWQDCREMLLKQLPDEEWGVIMHPKNRGLAAAVNSAWRAVSPDVDYLFHMEDDFVFNEDVPLQQMVRLLEEYPYLTQVSLKRQAVGNEPPGGFMSRPDFQGVNRDGWLMHRAFFTLNPSLIPRRVFGHGWPAGNEAEMRDDLYGANNPAWHGAYLGQLDSPPMVHHVGNDRSLAWQL